MTRSMRFAAPLFVLAINAPSAHAQRAHSENATAGPTMASAGVGLYGLYKYLD